MKGYDGGVVSLGVIVRLKEGTSQSGDCDVEKR